MKLKQVIVMRKDLNMRKGKMCSSAAHASSMVIYNHFMQYSLDNCPIDEFTIRLPYPSKIVDWVNDYDFTKIVVYVNSEKELLELNEKCEQQNIIHFLVRDLGKTEFHGVETPTCIAIGPDMEKVIDGITGHLPLI